MQRENFNINFSKLCMFYYENNLDRNKIYIKQSIKHKVEKFRSSVN